MREMKRRKAVTFVAIAAMLLLGAMTATAADTSYHVVATYKVGAGSPGGIQLDAEARRIYLAHGDRVDVLDADTGKKVGEIAAKGANDIALAAEFKHGFASNGSDNTVTMFDTATLKVLKTIKLDGKTPDAMVYDGGSKRVFVAERGSGTVAAIDPATGDVMATSARLGGELRGMATNGYGDLYVAAEDKNVVHVVDTKTLGALGDFPVGSGEGPTGLAIDAMGRRLFVACKNGTMPVIDTDIGFTFEELPMGTGEAGDTFTFAPQGKGGWKGAIFVASADGTLSIERMLAFISYEAGTKVTLAKGIHAVAYDPKTHRVFVPAMSGNEAVILAVGQ